MSREKAVIIGALGASITWQAYVAVMALRYGPRFEMLFSALGAELPVVTRALVATYRGWLVVPVVFALLAVRVVRKEASSPAGLGLLVASSVSMAFALQAWLYEGYFAPMLSLIEQIR